MALGGLFPTHMRNWLELNTERSLNLFGHYYLYLGCFIVALLLILAVSKWGGIRLGEGKPEFPLFSWVAMLYSTGMGAGLLLRAVQEPVYFFQHPPGTPGYELEVYALQYTFFHWGLTPWAFYGMFGLIIAYNLYLKKGTILSSAILPYSYQKLRWVTPIDTVTVISTLLGVVAAVGLGSRQLTEGFAYIIGIPSLPAYYTILVVVLVGGIATLSAYLGVSRGIRLLSNFNISLALFLLFFSFFQGDMQLILQRFVHSLYYYFRDFIPMSLNVGKSQVPLPFLTEWTYFYWAFWLAWAPFTGVFIARISRGRTIRSMILGSLLIPSIGTFFWFSVFGSEAFLILKGVDHPESLFDSIYTGIFNFFDFLPFSGMSQIFAFILIGTFLITSIDSAIYVLGMFTDNGSPQPRKPLRIFWGVVLVLFTSSLIMVGKEELLSSVSQMLILFALPFSFLFLGMILYMLYFIWVAPINPFNTKHPK
ncbi:BCCT transporter [Anditalea andensis]|uniref:BCCT transporter n=2 Tax=Anditalea andensis TaxID=1048983 RepID=A0A074L675_9BACT|nr:BCCT transporter [Anditalea andensis]